MTGVVPISGTTSCPLGAAPAPPAPTDPYQAAYLYLLELCRAEAQLHVDLALEATGVLEARKHGLGDSRRPWEWQHDKPIDITILTQSAA